MASTAEKSQPHCTKADCDQIFLQIFEQMGRIALEGAVSCTGAIFDLSANYLERSAFETLRKFYEIYFERGEIEAKKDAVNASVDDMVAQLQERLARGEDITDGGDIDDDEEMRRQRLSLSAVQKQLEGLITLDNGIKQQVIPALASMQFEDAVSQRIQHLVTGWKRIGAFIHTQHSSKDVEDLAREMGRTLTAVEETKAYYDLVLLEPAPEGQDQRSIFIEF